MNNIPKGYKQTKVGVIPEDWEVVRLGEIGKTYNGLTGKNADDFQNGNAKFITYKNIFDNSKGFFNFEGTCHFEINVNELWEST